MNLISFHDPTMFSPIMCRTTLRCENKDIFIENNLKVLGKSVGLCKTTKRKDQLYISLLVSVWRIICEHCQPKWTHIS